MRSFASTLLLAFLASTASAHPGHGAQDIFYVTVTRTQYTCPCDASTSTSYTGLPHPTGPLSASTNCWTHLTSGSVLSVSTQWTTSHSPCSSTITSTITTTSTPTPATSTTTSTITDTTTVTALTTLLTATATETDTATSTVSITSTDTVTSIVSSTSTATSTIPTTSGFIVVQASLPGSTYDGSGGSDPVAKRDVRQSSNAAGGSPFGHDWNPDSVVCTLSTTSPICSSTTTATTTTATASASISTVSATVTTTLTTTFVPSATTTITTTTTTTSTATDTVTTTTTSTTTSLVATTTTTVYAACATNNFASQVNGNNVVNFGGSYNGISTSTQDSVYDCCVSAFTSPFAIQLFFYQAGTCYLAYHDGSTQGDSPQSSNSVEALTGRGTPAIIGNGPDGEVNTSGSG